MPFLLSFITPAIIRWLAIGGLISASLLGLYGKGRYDGRTACEYKYEKAYADAIDDALEASRNFDKRMLDPHELRKSDKFKRD